jgi:hypothetical protein
MSILEILLPRASCTEARHRVTASLTSFGKLFFDDDVPKEIMDRDDVRRVIDGDKKAADVEVPINIKVTASAR